jgi:Zn-dependent M28 family amino/carboxypeptidase
LGSLAYCHAYQNELKNTALNINLDMLGSVMGEFVAFSCANEHTAEFMKRFFSKHRYPASVKHAIRSSDSNSFVYYGVPALSFARYAPSNTGAVHTPYDKAEIVSAKTLLADMKIIAKLTDLFVSAQPLPASLDISDKIKDDVENYMKRKKSIPRI